MKYDVYGIGNALVDYLAFVDDEFLRKNRIQKGLMTLVATPGHEIVLSDKPAGFEKSSGGSAANTAVGVARMGGRACFSGKVARDLDGEFYARDLAAVGVHFCSNPTDGITGSCVSLITPDGQRSMLTHLGVSSIMGRSDVSKELISQSRFLYVEGYQWSSDMARDTSMHAMELAAKLGTKVAFTYSDPSIVRLFRGDFMKVTREYVDLLFCNEDEAMEITGEQSSAAAITTLMPLADMVCVTTGPTGAIVAVDDVVTVTPALRIEKVVDTTGAGDMYAAGVLRGLTAGFDLVCSSMIGSRMAAAIVGQVGARLP